MRPAGTARSLGAGLGAGGLWGSRAAASPRPSRPGRCGRGAFTVWLGVWRRAPSARARRACPPFGACPGAPSSGHGPVSRSWDPAARNCSERFQMDITHVVLGKLLCDLGAGVTVSGVAIY